MTTAIKINNDFESKRLQRNMTDTQKRNSNNVKEGKLVNAFVKDPNLSLDETLDTLVISQSEVELPKKLDEIETSKDKSLYYLAGISIGVMGILGGFTLLMKNFSKQKLNTTKEFLLPGITRNHCINNEIHQSIFSMIQSPNRRTILSAIGVIVLGSMAFLAKTFIDGFRDVWIKQKEADIQKKLQENLIEVERQSFSGKIEIIRSILSNKAKIFSENLQPSFKKNKKDITENKNSNIPFALAGILSLSSILALGYFSMRNIRKSEEFIKQGLKNTREGLEKVIQEFNNKQPINDIECHNGQILKGKDAYKYIIENMLEGIFAKPNEIEDFVKKMEIDPCEKKDFINHLKSAMNQATEKVNSAIGGSGRNKITYFSHVNDYLSFFYDWLMNPKNPQFKNLFIGISGVSALAYCGKTASEAVKDIQVKKYSADIELDLQKRLVATELRNFKAKKDSAIEPLCEEFFIQKEKGKSPEELKIIADNILFEIKNGPPFVYS
ncbi:hypothetical protein J6R97_00290 [bacterium]|nr:hypothetical protein [bacterium]